MISDQLITGFKGMRSVGVRIDVSHLFLFSNKN
jgi:hypothetical protein